MSNLKYLSALLKAPAPQFGQPWQADPRGVNKKPMRAPGSISQADMRRQDFVGGPSTWRTVG
jgi:hypothetical protein